MKKVMKLGKKVVKIQLIIIFLLGVLAYNKQVIAYGQRALNLGLTNFWDGGPLRPKSGWYYFNYDQYYCTNSFLDYQGKPLAGIASPNFNALSNVFQLLYESDLRIARARIGYASSISAIFLATIDKNNLGFVSSGSGWSDLRLDLYLQWNPVMYHGRPIFITNVDFGVFLPSGKNEYPCATLNPGNKTYGINPYWAATLYLKESWTIAWRIFYLWSTENHQTHLKAGDVIHGNFSTEWQIHKRFHVGINGYFLRQLHNNTLSGQLVPHSKERVTALGPGFFYFLPHKIIISGHLYGEFSAKNRPQGMSMVFRLIKYF